jgi:Ca2+-binding EF-hand superfamily protein
MILEIFAKDTISTHVGL